MFISIDSDFFGCLVSDREGETILSFAKCFFLTLLGSKDV